MTDRTRLTATVTGRVQGVGFRMWTQDRAVELGLAGSAVNLAGGGVEVTVDGPRGMCERLLAALRGASAPGRVDAVTAEWSEPRPDTGDRFTTG